MSDPSSSTDPRPDPAGEDTPTPDYDSPWKEAIGAYFQPFMALFFPSVQALIDWSHPYAFLDAELQKITGDSEIGQRRADRLVRVRSRDGRELWLLIHIEVQGKADAPFNARMFQYYYRIQDRYAQMEIISLAVVTNQRARTTHGVYARERDGFGVRFRFRVHHLQQWSQQLAALKALVATNPFAAVALAQLTAHRRSSDPERKASKREIIWLLYQYRYSRADVLALLRLIDWLIRLPPALELELRSELIALEEHTKMSYVMSIERMAEERGVAIGEQRGEQRGEARILLRLLTLKFGGLSPEIQQRVSEADADTLLAWSERVLTASTLEDVIR